MLDPPPMIEFLELHACSVRIKGRHAPSNGARAAIAAQTSSTVYSTYVARQRMASVGFKLAVRGDSEAGASTLCSILR